MLLNFILSNSLAKQVDIHSEFQASTANSTKVTWLVRAGEWVTE